MELAVLGMTCDEERVYEALVAQPGLTAAALADHLEAEVAPLRRVLNSLVDKHLATRSGRPTRYLAAPPDIAINHLVQTREKELSAARAKAYALSEIHRNATRARPELAIEQLTDRETIASAVELLESKAQHQVRVFDTPPYYEPPDGEGAARNTATQIARHQRDGVAHRVIYSQDALTWPKKLETGILPAIRGGEQARMRRTLPLKLIIRDDQDALIPFDLSRSGLQVAYLVRRSPLFTALEALFEGEWTQAVPLDAGATAPTAVDGPDEETRSLLAMMMAGLTDTAIAHAKGWSTRTTYRRLQDLLTELGASTRFQAGCIAERRGWL
ncbi:helix-turn-helix domain-containing protein [Actinacidiphila guanduensis]|uniref:Sugar-specific transcriptional regulator TrmB n=1 Tax=Actinacidiphila guanduensis TaxID=310781 RepID=A0A1H0HF74_9ACTN|nr:helix-turn-helix domain-containing protein [Actinacidiphila guanduensis]SDO17798.1 Sugar-specific transcriptional regulator TrmB [Actinacidiphila guanduensis]